MELPTFLLADNTDLPEDIFIVHTQYPRFIWNVNQDEVEWIDELEGEDDNMVNDVANLLDLAETFYERELKSLEDEDLSL